MSPGPDGESPSQRGGYRASAPPTVRQSAGSAPTKSKLVTGTGPPLRGGPLFFVGPAFRYPGEVAATTGDRARTEIPGPRSREIGERLDARRREPARGHVPGRRGLRPRRDAHRRRRQHVHRLRRRRRLPERRPRAPRRRRRRARAARPLRPHRLHDRPVRGLRRRSPSGSRRAWADLRPGQGRVLQRRHRGGRERRQVRPRLHGPAGGDRLRGRASTAAPCSRCR